MNKQELFSYNLKKLRKSKGMTQKELADKLNISDKNLSKWECGRAVPDIFYLQELSKIFEVDINTFFEQNDLSADVNNVSEKLQKLRRIAYVWCMTILFLGILNMAVVAIAKVFLPTTIPAHYNIKWQVDRWASSNEFLIVGIIMSAMCLFALILPASVCSDNTKMVKSAMVFSIIAIMLIPIYNFAYFIFLAVLDNKLALAEGYLPYDGSKFPTLFSIIISILYAFSGYITSIVKQNEVVGLRLNITSQSEYAWNVLNKLCGSVMMACAFISLCVIGFFVGSHMAMVVNLVYPIIVLIITIIIGVKYVKRKMSAQDYK